MTKPATTTIRTATRPAIRAATRPAIRPATRPAIRPATPAIRAATVRERSTRSTHPRRAFTLVELMVAITIILIVVGIATPSILKMMESTRVARGRNLVRGLMTSAQAYAIAHRVHAGYRFQRAGRDGRYYAVLVYHDENLQTRYNAEVDNITVRLGQGSGGQQPMPVSQTSALCLFAVAETTPLRFPPGTDILQRNFHEIDSPYDQATNSDLDDQYINDPDRNKVANARTFTILFDPAGRPTQRYALVRRRTNAEFDEDPGFDSVFNEADDIAEGTALLKQDGPKNSGQAVAELSENGLILIDTETFEAMEPGKRYTDYVKDQPIWILNPYSGALIEIGATQEGT